MIINTNQIKNNYMDFVHEIIQIPDKLILSVNLSSKSITYKYIDRIVKLDYEIIHTDYVKLSTNKDEDNDKYLTEHIIRVIKCVWSRDTFDMNGFYDIAQFIVKVVTNPYIYCTICGKTSDYRDEKIESCETCFYNYCECVTDDIISINIKRDKLVVLLLINTVIECLKSNRVEKLFNPRPLCCKTKDHIEALKKDIIDGKLYDKIKEINNFDLHDDDLDDTKMNSKLGIKMYGFLKYLILTNKTHIMSEKMDTIKQKDIFSIDIGENKNNTNLQDFLNFNIVSYNESPEFSAVDKPFYVYHGSNISCWYSIMRNGLRNYSGTDMMVNGAALGAGIYFATDPKMAFGYSHKHTSHKDKDDEIMIVGVAQLLHKEKYDKGNGVYVVSNEKDVILRYLVVVNSIRINKVKEFFNARVCEIQLLNKMGNKHNILVKRLMSEHKQVVKFLEKQDKNNTLQMEKDDVFNWKITMNNYIFEVKFDRESYPLVPPNILLLNKNNNNIHLKNITQSNGTIKIRELQINNWTITSTILQILKKLNNIII